MIRPPPVDELVSAFLAHWDDHPGDLDGCVKLIRDIVIAGPARARARSGLLERRRQRLGVGPAPHLRLIQSNAFVIRNAAAAGGVDAAQVTGDDRTRTASRVRFEAMWILRRARKLSWPEIGAVMRRTHSAAIRGVRIVDERAAREPGLARRLRRMARPG